MKLLKFVIVGLPLSRRVLLLYAIQYFSFRVGQEGNPLPLISSTPPDNYIPTFDTICIRTHHNRYGYWKFISHPEFHAHGEGAYL